MTEQDIEAENTQLLLTRWKLLVVEHAEPARIGLTTETAQVLSKLDARQVARAAQVHCPLFDFACTPESLEAAFSTKVHVDDERDEDGLLFLVNRWRACEGSFVTAQMLYSMSRNMHAIVRNATYSKIIAAANSGISLLKLAVRPHYLFHAGNKFDLHTGHRTSLAICNSIRP